MMTHYLNRFSIILFTLFSSLVLAQSHVKTELISDVSSFVKGQEFNIGVHMTMSDHWHTYWENPGSSGLPTDVEWDLPEGLELGTLQFPVAKKFVDEADFVTYGYDDETLLISQAVYNGPAQEITIKGKVNWLECNQMCLPGSSQVSLTLKVGDAAPSTVAPLFEKFEKSLPRPYNSDAPFVYDTHFRFSADKWDATLSVKLKDKGKSRGKSHVTAFFPGANDDSELVQSTLNDGTFNLSYEPFGDIDTSNLVLSGIIAIEKEGLTQYFRLPLYPEVKAQSIAPPSTDAPAQPDHPGFFYILLLAFIGGLILNLMPCVLPVLSIKVFSIISEAGESTSRRVQFGWMYTFGIMISFAVLAGFLIAAKAGGEAVGIGFQFQNPGFVIGMIVLIFVMGLSFVGVFEISAPQSQKIQGLAQKKGLMGAFYQGGLMTLLSTPCTAPGLGVAYGWAVTASTWQILLIFEVIALGLSFPYLVLCYSPALLRFLPKPGAWMDHFKVVMGFLLFGTVIWLFNTLMDLSGATAVTGTLTLLLFVACAAWIHGKTWFSGPRMKSFLLNVILIAAGIYIGLFKLFSIQNPTQAKKDHEETLRLKFLSLAQNSESGNAPSLIAELEARKTTAEKIAWIPYSPMALDHFRKQGKLVFLDFTAEWCATCKVNEKLVIDTKAIRSEFANQDVVAMRVDFTDKDPEILKFMQTFQRAGVPIYVFYPGDQKPVVLPETITKGIVLEGLQDAREKLEI